MLKLAIFLLSGSMAMAAPQPRAVQGEYVVKLKPTISRMTKATAAHVLGFEVKELLSVASNVALVKAPKSSRGNTLRSLSQNPFVEYAEPNYLYFMSKTPNDKEYGRLWGMKNTGQSDAAGQVGVEGVDIKAEEAWEITTGSKDAIVAVIDTGVDPRLNDLKNNMWVNEKESKGKAGVDDDGNGFVDDINGYDFVNNDGDPTDDHGHGSHVAGTIGGSGNNGSDVVGVNWNTRIMGVKFLSKEGSGTLADAIKAIDYATLMGARVMNNSWGGGPYSKALEDSIKRAAEKNSLFVAAAGNSAGDNDSSPTYPSSYEVENVVSVAAIDNKGALASFSCYGKKSVDIGAPGVKILSTTPAGLQAWSGTSMATPHAAGVAALVLSVEPNLTAAQLKERLLKTATPLSSLRGKTVTGGLLNAYNAIKNIQAPPDPNDPANWNSQPYALSTPHPYTNNWTKTFSVKAEGVKKFAVFFSKFETESGYDHVEFIDGTGKVVGKWSGNHSEDFSPVVEGDTMTIRVTTDDSQTGHGFDISKIAFQ